jgi:hypothetical protein
MALLRIVLAIFLGLLVSQASAHGNYVPSNASGIPIPSLSHGEMAVVSQYRSRILLVAGQVNKTDPMFRTLLNFGAIEYSYCLWGTAPGAITDEMSPFNECAHAYLAAAKALLFHMRDMPEVSARADTLISDIDADVVRTGAALIGCRFSGETFNTADFVRPHWENLTQHRPTLYAIGAGLLLLISPVLVRLALPRRTSGSIGA